MTNPNPYGPLKLVSRSEWRRLKKKKKERKKDARRGCSTTAVAAYKKRQLCFHTDESVIHDHIHTCHGAL